MSTASPTTFPTLPLGTPPELTAAIGDAALRAFHEHGAVAFAAARAAAIAHEAGHAVVGAAQGFRIRKLTIFPRPTPDLGQVWGGRCMEADGTWNTGPDSSADDDLRRARFIVAGLAGEAIAGLDSAGSSLDELALSQLVGMNAAVKRADPMLSDEAYAAYVQQLWHEQVWDVAIAILHANYAPFMQLAEHLNQRECIKAGKLHKVLAQVNRSTS